jgi:arylsulfatase A-like enzyme
MFTGLLPSFHGGTEVRGLHSSIPYLPEVLSAAGYHSGGVATWINLSQLFGFQRGFHIYRVFSDPQTRAEAVVDAGIELLRRAEDQRQFLFLHFLDPHAPYLPTDDFMERFGPSPKDVLDLNDRIMKAGGPVSEEDTEALIRLYDSEIAYVDRALGRFFGELKTMGLYEQSLIVLTADHGEAFFEHGHWQHTHSLYEEILRVPLIVKWPGRSPKGRVKNLVSLIDIFPTLVEAVGLSPPTTSAVSLARYTGEGWEPPDSPLVISEAAGWWSADGTPMKISFRTGELKYMAALQGSREEELSFSHLCKEELYNLSKDPREQQSLLASSPGDAESFRRQLQDYLEDAERFRANRLGQTVVIDEATKKRLRSLGYVER